MPINLANLWYKVSRNTLYSVSRRFPRLRARATPTHAVAMFSFFFSFGHKTAKKTRSNHEREIHPKEYLMANMRMAGEKEEEKEDEEEDKIVAIMEHLVRAMKIRL